ncbi:protein of unknown function [Candidatus Nitrosocosmicus franklandus]|uniref:Uncharacterized protein n=1 Tax=Candidatus Nitrosocosmicus franklandianus TaxID=1798806 RepID=A0A484IFJ0_9ARCH|nr:protein of unknown function [Candidatus Nitrosocosmicus franklandus]
MCVKLFVTKCEFVTTTLLLNNTHSIMLNNTYNEQRIRIYIESNSIYSRHAKQGHRR